MSKRKPRIRKVTPKSEEILVAPEPTEPEPPTPEPEPKLATKCCLERPEFVSWTYGVKEVEAFREAYAEFCRRCRDQQSR